MSGLAFKTVVYHGYLRLGELDAVPADGHSFQFPNNEIRIHHISPVSERCPPLSILQTVSSFSVLCKLESSSPVEQDNLISLHASCFQELKTAVVLLGEEELHLVAMPSKQKKSTCFWCFSVPLGLYESSLRLLNLRCLGIVFDLDETLVVANTMKSFGDRIEALRGRIARETDSVRISGMLAELKRYVDDRALLKQYADCDCVTDNGKMYKVQVEEVPQLSDSHEKVIRPVIRLQEKNIILTRINPEIHDTSVLVRLRPAWDQLRSYLTAKGRKRFEVYVCTMAERDYALEMWRLLDPKAHLINKEQVLNRVVCVKSGSRKSLLNVFRDGNCHPKMAMVIDDQSKVWEHRDQPRVHVVPPFAPYYAPQAQTTNAIPVLCMARNVVCNVRGYFFKEFDENLLNKTSEVFYEDEVVTLPHAPDVSNYLLSEDSGFVPHGAANARIAEGMHDTKIEKRLNLPFSGTIVLPVLRIITLPKALVSIWERLDSVNKIYVEKRIGYLISLLYVEPRVAMIKVVSHFWNPKTSVFVFSQSELSPTIKDYDITSGRVHSLGLGEPPIEINPILLLRKYLGVDASQIKLILKANSNGLPLTFLEKHFLSLLVFLLAYYGFASCPHCQTSLLV